LTFTALAPLAYSANTPTIPQNKHDVEMRVMMTSPVQPTGPITGSA
jgi:hypothetical protein